MYIKVISCQKTSEGAIVELQIDQKGLKVNSILSSSESSKRWKVESRIIYSPFREIHKKFPFEKLRVIRVDLPEENKEKLKLELYEKENKNIFQYHITGDRHHQVPKSGETLLCASY